MDHMRIQLTYRS